MRGEGVKPDALTAWAWFKLAADAGVAAANQSAALVAAQFDPTTLAAAEARAAQLAHPDAPLTPASKP